MTNADRLDRLDSDVVRAVLHVRRAHNAAQRRLKLPITDHSDRSPFEQEEARDD